MSETSYSSTRKLLTDRTDLTTLVPANSIKMGFMLEPDVYPCVTITKTGGTSWGYLGYGSSPAGSKMRRANYTFQIDIYSRSGLLHLEKISDQVILALMSGNSYRLVSDTDWYEDGISAYRKIQTWTFWDNIDD